MEPSLKLSEAQVKSAVQDCLQILQNQGSLWFARLNSGDFIEVRGDTRRRIKGCPTGTADFVVISGGKIIFLECKSTKGKQSREQIDFEEMILRQKAEYYVIRDAQQVMILLIDTNPLGNI